MTKLPKETFKKYKESIGLPPETTYREIYHNAYWATLYAINLGERCPDAEPFIMRDPHWSGVYAWQVIKGRWPKAEPVIMRELRSTIEYCRDVIKGRWPETEAMVMGWNASTDKDLERKVKWVVNYAIFVMGGRWTSQEELVAMDAHWSQVYRAHFGLSSLAA